MAQNNDAAGAEEHYRQALTHDAQHVEALEALEAMARKGEQWERLAELLELKAELPDLAVEQRLPLLQELGLLYCDRLGQADRGVGILEQARELAPDTPEVLAALVDAYYAADDLDRAEPLIKQLIEVAGTKRRKDLARYVHRLGAIFEKRGDTAGAREHYDKAYRMDSTNTPTLVALGRIHMQEQDWDSARRVYRSLLLQNLDQHSGITKADLFYNLGQVHAALGETAKARNMYERGLEADASHPGLQAALVELG